MKKVFNYVVIRFEPDLHLDQFINVGVVVIETHPFKLDYKISFNQEKVHKIFNITDSYYDTFALGMESSLTFIQRKLETMNEEAENSDIQKYLKGCFSPKEQKIYFSPFYCLMSEKTLQEITEEKYKEFVTTLD